MSFTFLFWFKKTPVLSWSYSLSTEDLSTGESASLNMASQLCGNLTSFTVFALASWSGLTSAAFSCRITRGFASGAFSTVFNLASLCFASVDVSSLYCGRVWLGSPPVCCDSEASSCELPAPISSQSSVPHTLLFFIAWWGQISHHSSCVLEDQISHQLFCQKCANSWSGRPVMENQSSPGL